MKKRLIPLLMVVGMTMAPSAMASHCERCGVQGTEPACKPAVLIAGWATCVVDASGCWVADPCEPHGAALNALATEFTVASVERLDEPNAKPSEPLVASLETTTERIDR
jgi:hypothetical protein